MAKKSKQKKDDEKRGGGRNSESKRYFLKRLTRHLGTDPARLVVVEQTFAPYQRPNLHLAFAKLLAGKGVAHELEGVLLDQDYQSLSLARLSRAQTAAQVFAGPVEYADVTVADGRKLACVKRGLYWVTTPQGPLAMLVYPERHAHPPQIQVEMMAADRAVAEDFTRRLAVLVNDAAAFRGQVLSLEQDCYRQLQIQFHRLPTIRREEIILPDAVLARIDRHAETFSRHAEQLKSAGRHLKRGILLHGPPGTGKTLSAMYLASQMAGRTVMLLTGGGVAAIEASGQLARTLAPVTVILEDVDLIGTQREHQSVGANALLFELLNQMDGLAEDADVLFVLTSNRPEILEPALASRPGRIDQAIEIPLPDESCRRRLLELYSRGMRVELDDADSVIKRTEGVSAAFMRELLRKAALFAAEADGDGELTVRDAHVAAALDELTIAGGLLTRTLLGASKT
jgi:cell division protease FtsH